MLKLFKNNKKKKLALETINYIKSKSFYNKESECCEIKPGDFCKLGLVYYAKFMRCEVYLSGDMSPFTITDYGTAHDIINYMLRYNSVPISLYEFPNGNTTEIKTEYEDNNGNLYRVVFVV